MFKNKIKKLVLAAGLLALIVAGSVSTPFSALAGDCPTAQAEHC